MNPTFSINKIRWQCRRGMLELDIILEKFLNQHFEKLTANEQQAFVNLLTREDADLYAWLLSHENPINQQDKMIIDKIRQSCGLSLTP